MNELDPATLDSDTPRMLDGRKYPEHLRAFHRYDDMVLPLVAQLAPVTFDDLSLAVSDASARAALPRWLTSAEWRGLIEYKDGVETPRRYTLGPKAKMHESSAA